MPGHKLHGRVMLRGHQAMLGLLDRTTGDDWSRFLNQVLPSGPH